MGISEALTGSLKKNIKWIILAMLLYLLPVFYRFQTSNSIVPIIDKTLFIYHINSQIVPVNLETLGVTFLIPSALGAIVGLNFLENIFERRFKGMEKYMGLLFGSLAFTFAWISVHYIGYNFITVVLPWGSSLWIGPSAYARNLLVAAIAAPVVPYIIRYAITIILREPSAKIEWKSFTSK